MHPGVEVCLAVGLLHFPWPTPVKGPATPHTASLTTFIIPQHDDPEPERTSASTIYECFISSPYLVIISSTKEIFVPNLCLVLGKNASRLGQDGTLHPQFPQSSPLIAPKTFLACWAHNTTCSKSFVPLIFGDPLDQSASLEVLDGVFARSPKVLADEIVISITSSVTPNSDSRSYKARHKQRRATKHVVLF